MSRSQNIGGWVGLAGGTALAAWLAAVAAVPAWAAVAGAACAFGGVLVGMGVGAMIDPPAGEMIDPPAGETRPDGGGCGPADRPVNPLGIASVTYRRLRSFGNYENEAVEATAVVRDGDSASVALEDLKAWVEARLGLAAQRASMEEESARLSAEIEYKNRQLARAEERFRKAQEFLRENKIDPHADDTPF